MNIPEAMQIFIRRCMHMHCAHGSPAVEGLRRLASALGGRGVQQVHEEPCRRNCVLSSAEKHSAVA